MTTKNREVMPNGRKAPQLWVRFKCQDCPASDYLNVFLGAPFHCDKPMVAYLYDKDNFQVLR